jgi:hypothetical protein
MKWVLFLLLSNITMETFAFNTPCSGKKGGVSHCQNGLVICNDDSTSQSKKYCSDNNYHNTTTPPSNTVDQTKIYKFIDKNGTTHFSDR